MPVIAESPPLVFGATPTPKPRVTPTPTPKPRVTPTPRPGVTPKPGQGVSQFVARHVQFIDHVDRIGSCFKREELNDFSDQEFSDHTQVAMKDRYIAQEKDMYCSMQGVQALTKTLRRLGED